MLNGQGCRISLNIMHRLAQQRGLDTAQVDVEMDLRRKRPLPGKEEYGVKNNSEVKLCSRI